MTLRVLFDVSNEIFEMGLSPEQVEALLGNNNFFLIWGTLAIEISVRTEQGLTWSSFKKRWWRPFDRVAVAPEQRIVVLRLAYLAYSAGRGAGSPLPDDIKALRPTNGCAFPLCSRTDDLQEDHVWPRALGGPDARWNKQSLCGFHNRLKSSFPGLNFCEPGPLIQALERAFP